MTPINFLLLVAFTFTSVLATPEVGFPFDEQLPTVARENVFYQFQLNNETFVSDTSEVEFDAENLPSWLSFDSATRTLTGTPKAADVTSHQIITLVGTDDTGSISRNYTMIVSADPGPELSSADIMFEELATFGNTNGHDGLSLRPGEQFTLNFSKSTFDIPEDSSASIVAYYGRSGDRTSLPSWIKFNEQTVSFYGTLPLVNSKIAPSEEFSFALIASDIEDYAGAIGTFSIVVGAHELSTSLSALTVLNGTTNQTIEYKIPFDEIFLDSEPIAEANVSYAALYGNPSWISLENDTVSGTVPDDLTSDDETSFNYTLWDVYGNSVSILFEVDVMVSLFTVDSLPELNATRGQWFSYSLMRSMFTDLDAVSVSATFDGDATGWLSFHESNLTFSGQVPSDFDDLTVEIEAQRKSGSLKKRAADSDDTLSFEITGVDKKTRSSSHSKTKSSSKSSSTSKSSASKSSSISSSASSSASSASSSPQTTDPASHNGSKSNNNSKKTLAIALGVAIPVLFLLLLALILFCCCWRRRKNAQDKPDSEKSPAPISGPILDNPLNLPNHRSDSEDDDTFDVEDSPKRLSTLNVLKLDNRDYTDNMSDSSSTTNVEESSIYQDAMQTQSTDQLVNGPGLALAAHQLVPRRSWRRPTPRESVGSIDTVATEELFTVRAVDEDNIKRHSAMSMFYLNQLAPVGSSSSSVLTRDSTLGNFQRLDSDGNVVSMSAPYSDSRLSSRVMSNLEVLQEEQLLKLRTYEHPELSSSNSPEQLAASTTSTATSIPDEFRARETSSGVLKWDHINESSQLDPKFDFEATGNVPATLSSSRYNSTLSFQANRSNSTIVAPGAVHQPQRQGSTSSARARLVEFENQKRLYNFEPIVDHGENSDESESAEISFMV